MTWDPHLADLMSRYNFSIVSMQGMEERNAPWSISAGGLSFESSGRWRDVVLHIRRDLRCEHCGVDFAYTFKVVEQSYSQRGRSTSDYVELTHALEKELQRRIRCPECGSIQRKVRQQMRQRERYHSFVGLSTIGGSVLGAIVLISGGYALAGLWGLFIGGGGAIALMLYLVRWMLARILK